MMGWNWFFRKSPWTAGEGSSGTEKLHKATQDGNLSLMKEILDSGQDPNATDKEGRSALGWASARARNSAIRLLIERGADPNIASGDGTTPLITAATSGHLECVQTLVDCGALVNKGGPSYPLVGAALNGHLEVVRALLENGADPNVMNLATRNTALMAAVAFGHAEIQELLESHGAKVVTSIRDPADVAMSAKCWVKFGLGKIYRTDQDPDVRFLLGYIHGVVNACANATMATDEERIASALALFLEQFGESEGAKAWTGSNKLASQSDQFWTRGYHKGTEEIEAALTVRPSRFAVGQEVGVLFNIDNLGSSRYSHEAWRLLYTTVYPADLQPYCYFFSGDVDIRVGDRPYTYCIGIGVDPTFSSNSAPLEVFSRKLWVADDPGFATRCQRFIRGADLCHTHGLIRCMSLTGNRIAVSDTSAFGWLTEIAKEAGW